MIAEGIEAADGLLPTAIEQILRSTAVPASCIDFKKAPCQRDILKKHDALLFENKVWMLSNINALKELCNVKEGMNM